MIETILSSFLGLGPEGWGLVAVLAVATLAFLPVPDVDLWLIRLLHHRSILTHSAGWPFLVLWAAGPLGLSGPQGVAAAAGAGLGVSVHLAADLLSPSRGYGRIWWPEPLQVSLGGWSRPWILANGVAAAGLAFLWLPEGLRGPALVVGTAAALGYGIRRERSLLSAVVALGVVGAGWAASGWIGGL